MSFKGKVVAVSRAAGVICQSVCRYLAGEGVAIATEGIIRVQDTFPTYWPEFNGVRGGALRDEFAYFATCALNGETPNVGVRTMPPPLSKRRWRLRNRRAPAM